MSPDLAIGSPALQHLQSQPTAIWLLLNHKTNKATQTDSLESLSCLPSDDSVENQKRLGNNSPTTDFTVVSVICLLCVASVRHMLPSGIVATLRIFHIVKIRNRSRCTSYPSSYHHCRALYCMAPSIRLLRLIIWALSSAHCRCNRRLRRS
jgi:hypothetical protein